MNQIGFNMAKEDTMNAIGFQASAEASQNSEHSEEREYSLVVRKEGVVRLNGGEESELAFAMCLWGTDEVAGVGLHTPDGPKALVGHLAMLLIHDKLLRTMLADACRTAELLAAARGEE